MKKVLDKQNQVSYNKQARLRADGAKPGVPCKLNNVNTNSTLDNFKKLFLNVERRARIANEFLE